MASTVDYDAQQSAYKILNIVYMIGITASCGALLFKLLMQVGNLNRLFRSQSRYMIMTLVAGDLFLAFFSLLVGAIISFGDESSVSCQTLFVSQTYGSYYLPFVFGVGVSTLCLELWFRGKLRASMRNHFFLSTLMAGVPWISGLVIMLPLALSGFYYNAATNSCTYELFDLDRMRAQFVIGIVLPAAFAIILAFSLKFQRINAVADNFSVTGGAQAGIVISTVASQEQQQQHQPYYPGQQSTYPSQQPQQQQPFHSPGQPYLPQQPFSQGDALQSHDNDVDASSAVENEKNTLCMISLANAVLTMPLGLYTVCYSLNFEKVPMDAVTEAVLSGLFQWMFYLRPIATAVIWYIHFK